MKIPDSLQTLGDTVFYECSKVVPSYFGVHKADEHGATSRVVAYLRTQQRTAALEKVIAEQAAKLSVKNVEQDSENAALSARIVDQTTEIAALTTENAEQATEITTLTTEVAALKIAALTTENTALTAENTVLTTENAEQATEITVLTIENAALKIATLTTEAVALSITNAPVHTDDFINTIDFKRRFVGFVHIEMLLVLREVCKEWNDVVVERVDESVESGMMMVQGGNDISYAEIEAREEMRELVTQVIFLLNVTKVGDRTCMLATNLVVVHISEGVVRIGDDAFLDCHRLTTVSFPTTLKSTGRQAF
ncbi:hypothetical protein TL16_g01293 [Triparma laevis f. inornata]|uniref:Uncharacterized protein n=2 Tax=Triparma laevis TaxID=1534972 RepID=A0A9W7FTW2_9STRA|nr:hypothetical protein TL16_g01293 [Triparma laevis f. inornata]GMI18252.1 hypothetical protein TrLO_g2750 [Triparma laevis f. longispina]